MLEALQAILLIQLERCEIIRTRLEATLLKVVRKKVITELFRQLDGLEDQVKDSYNGAYFANEATYLAALEKLKDYRGEVTKSTNRELCSIQAPKLNDFYP